MLNTYQAWRLPVAAALLFVSLSMLLLLSYGSASPVDDRSTVSDHLSVFVNNATVHMNAYQLDPPPHEPPFGALVVAARGNEDLNWMMFAKQNWTSYPYNVDNPQNEDERLRLPMAKGHEAMVYLTWIIEHYDTLPWSAIFVHGHHEAWHQRDYIETYISDLKLRALARIGYISLRCDWYPSCPAEIRPKKHDAVSWGPGVFREEAELAIAGNWRQLFPGEAMPETIASPCCAQFAVTRQAIWKRPRSEYEKLQKWLIDTLLEDDISGRVLEKLWAYIFTSEPVHCPPPSTCACKNFGRCEERDWQHPPEGIAIPSNFP